MDRTIRLFDKNAYAVDFSSIVISCSKINDCYEIVLEETLFFPEQGGQSPDKGFLGDAKVLDVQNKEGVIVHVTDAEPKTKNGIVSGKIDWNHRFSNMQQHSGEHVFSGIIHEKYGYDNKGFHLSDNSVTLDTSGPLTEEQIREIEKEANRVILENHIIKTYFPSEEELASIEFRCKDGIEGDVRLVEIDGVDTCACCAPHVMSTCQIGILKVVDFQNYKGGTRISILCGSRALEYIKSGEEILKKLTSDLSCKREQIPEFVDKIKEDKTQAIGKLKEYQAKELEKTLAEIDKDIESPVIFTEVSDSNAIRNAVNSLMEKHRGYCGVFAGCDGDYRYIIGSADKDCQVLMAKLKEAGAKGGGSKQMIQGTVAASKADIKMLIY